MMIQEAWPQILEGLFRKVQFLWFFFVSYVFLFIYRNPVVIHRQTQHSYIIMQLQEHLQQPDAQHGLLSGKLVCYRIENEDSDALLLSIICTIWA